MRVVGSNGMGGKEYRYACHNCENSVLLVDEYCKSCNRTLSGIADGIYMKPGVYITE